MIDDNTGITAAEMLSVISRGWSTPAEKEVFDFVYRKMTEIAEQTHKRLGSHCDKCGKSR